MVRRRCRRHTQSRRRRCRRRRTRPIRTSAPRGAGGRGGASVVRWKSAIVRRHGGRGPSRPNAQSRTTLMSIGEWRRSASSPRPPRATARADRRTASIARVGVGAGGSPRGRRAKSTEPPARCALDADPRAYRRARERWGARARRDAIGARRANRSGVEAPTMGASRGALCRALARANHRCRPLFIISVSRFFGRFAAIVDFQPRTFALFGSTHHKKNHIRCGIRFLPGGERTVLKNPLDSLPLPSVGSPATPRTATMRSKLNN